MNWNPVTCEHNCNQCVTLSISLNLKSQLNISWRSAVILQAETVHTAAQKDAHMHVVVFSYITVGRQSAALILVAIETTVGSFLWRFHRRLFGDVARQTHTVWGWGRVNRHWVCDALMLCLGRKHSRVGKQGMECIRVLLFRIAHISNMIQWLEIWFLVEVAILMMKSLESS